MKTKHEPRDVDVPSLFLVIVMLFTVGALIFLGVWIFLHWLRVRQTVAAQTPSVWTESAGTFPQPQLETRPGITLEAVRATEERRLHSYGWVDRNAGVAHIPIERAMQLLLERGLPEVGTGQTPLQFMQASPQKAAQ
jgi:hypothetical protein